MVSDGTLWRLSVVGAWYTHVYAFMYILVIVAVLGTEPKASYKLGKFSAVELCP